MRIGVMLDVRRGGLVQLIEESRDAADRGFAGVWMAQISRGDALTWLTLIGREVPRIELGTAVIPTYPRHPIALAMQALTVNAAVDGRLQLGIGLSHQIVIEGQYGYSFDKPARHMRDYLAILKPLLDEGKSDHAGETLTGRAQVDVPGSTPPPVLLAALAPQMLKLAGSVADGTITWMTGPATIESHIVPSINAAADAAGRPGPRVVCGLPVAVTDDEPATRELVAKGFAGYGFLPSYRAMLDKEGVEGPPDVAIVGDEKTVGAALRRLSDGGTTDFLAAVVATGDDRKRTLDFLASR